MPEWHWWNNRHDAVVFFGMYHIGDYARLLWHRGEKTIVWCGGDILNLKKSWWGQMITPNVDARHLCENEVEKLELTKYGIRAEVQPMCFDQIDNIEVSFSPSKKPHVYLCCHKGYEEEYGVNFIEGVASTIPEITFHVYGIEGESFLPNIIYHGEVSNEQFTEEIKKYQAGLRLNEFDGFSEVLAKSILMGQYPISTIYYPHIDYARSTTHLITLLRNLKDKKKPNTKGRAYWLQQLKKNPFL